MPIDTQTTVTAFIALGSNLGDREATIESARSAMNAHPRITTVRCSRLIETDPVGPAGQGPYLNGATEIATDLTPPELLKALLEIERSLGRVRSETDERWGARTIDLDILLYADEVIDEPGLTVPHPRMQERRFVLEPLAQIAPDARHPVLGTTASEMLEALIALPNATPQP
ncbi:MAG: 2-amino-4-hydroxy-6-hydroxymethyldihydropteridine diphosphokinase [Phycisphaerales bacterium JB050]